MIYLNLIGGLITCELPYILIIIFGWYFTHLKVFENDTKNPLSKIMIITTLPIYYFILIGKSNSVSNLQNYYIIIISDLIKTVFSIAISISYSYIFKMDSRYTYTWIAINCFQDIRLLSQSITKTFCYHLMHQSIKEKEFCLNSEHLSCIHLFFNLLIVWIVIYNLIKRDKQYITTKIIEEENIENKPIEIIKDTANENIIIKNKEIIKNQLNLNIENLEYKKDKKLNVSSNSNSYKKIVDKVEKTLRQKILYILFQPTIIAILCGFIIGFIPSLQNWWYNTNSVVFMFQDTLHSIGNSHIVCSYLIIGINLYLNEKGVDKLRFSKVEYIAHFIIKCFILPLIGLIFLTIARLFEDNRALLFTAYIQWFLPSSQDIMIISQSKNVSSYSVSLSILIQYCYMIIVNNFICMGVLMKIVGIH